MRLIPLLLFLWHFHNAKNEQFKDGYPSKHFPIVKKNAQLLLSSKHLKPTYFENHLKKTKKSVQEYTAFPKLTSLEKKIYDVPERSFFSIYNNDVQKPRVKKVLDAYPGPPRRKRSADKDFVKKSLKDVMQKTSKAFKDEDLKPKGNVNAKVRKSSKRRSRKTNKKRLGRSSRLRKNGTRLRSKNRNDTHSEGRMRRKSKRKRTSNLRMSKNINKTRILGKKSKKSRRTRLSRNGSSLTKANSGRRLVAARDAMIDDYPYVVSIQKDDEHWCAGALLNPHLVITTANCVWKSNRISRMRVRAGSWHADRDGQVTAISEVMKHPNWSLRKNPDNDVALLLLEKRIKFSNHVHGVDLPNRIMMPPFEDVWVTSWGAERRDGIYDKRTMSLQVYHALLIDRQKCNNITQRFGVTVTENFFCLAQTGKKSPCTRDTGAPAVSDGVVWGLASWGIRKLCGTERFPAVFSYLGSQTNLDFIANATRFLMSDNRMYPFLDRFPKVDSGTTGTTDINFK